MAAQKRMRATRRSGTAPELALREELSRLGVEYLADYKPLPDLRRTADIAIVESKTAVFVDGCFWHGCPLHGTWPEANGDYWRRKIEGNQRRDAETDAILTHAGWRVVRVWAHVPVADVADAVLGLGEHRARE